MKISFAKIDCITNGVQQICLAVQVSSSSTSKAVDINAGKNLFRVFLGPEEFVKSPYFLILN